MDIIVVWPEEVVNNKDRGQWLRKYIEETFKPGEIFHNDRAWSFNVDEIQVDIIMCEPENFNAMYHYLSYNDLGNFMGRLAHSLGFKYGQDGLVYDHYFKDKKIGRILVSQDYPRIFKFLDLDYGRWERGFDKLEDVFEFIVSSKYFSYEKFQLRSLNKINRERNLKRKSYMSFLDYIERYKDRNAHFESLKSEFMAEAIKMFPEFQYKLETRRLEYEVTRDLYIQAKFNGGEIMRRFGLQGKEIGETMEGFKERIYKNKGDMHGPAYFNFVTREQSFNNYVLNNSLESIYEKFEIYLKQNLKP
jgi:hypothetical protein